MARVNVYLPDDLALEAKRAGLNVSAITQDALRRSLTAKHMNNWLDEVCRAGRHFPTISDNDVSEAVHRARGEFGTGVD